MLRERERKSRRDGSTIPPTAINGVWVVHEIWRKAADDPSRASGALLRSLKATLSIEECTVDAHDRTDRLVVRNSVVLGNLNLCFTGSGRLYQKRPLLRFHFDRMELNYGSRRLFSMNLAEPNEKQKPFFALIAQERTAAGLDWLAARGRGGGIALWVRDDEQTA